MKTNLLLRKLGAFYPKKLKASFDHIGLMEGKLKPETKKILLCLDFDEAVLPYAIKEKPDLILTHHPFIFGTKAKVLKEDPLKKELYDKLEALQIPLYSMHTNFDSGNPGMNDALANQLGLLDVHPLSEEPMARGGRLAKSMEILEFAKYAKEKLNVSYGLLLPYGKKKIQSVALIGGGGWESNFIAQKEGYDIFISGDIPHHGRRDVIARKYNYLDLPHEIEKIFMKAMKETLLKIDPNLKVVIVDHEKEAEVI